MRVEECFNFWYPKVSLRSYHIPYGVAWDSSDPYSLVMRNTNAMMGSLETNQQYSLCIQQTNDRDGFTVISGVVAIGAGATTVGCVADIESLATATEATGLTEDCCADAGSGEVAGAADVTVVGSTSGIQSVGTTLLSLSSTQLRHRIDETPTSCAPIFPSLFSLCSHMKKYPFQLDVAF